MTSTLYLILKSLHIIGVISWMAGVLYLFRLFVYHVEETESVVKTRLERMERRLYRFITLPAMLVSLVFGIAMIVVVPRLLASPWLHAKLLFVCVLVYMTWLGSQQIEELAEGKARFTSRQLRMMNEIPTLAMILIVFLVVLKPFS